MSKKEILDRIEILLSPKKIALYKEKYSESKAREVAEFGVAEIEGSVMLARIFNEPKYLKEAHTRVLGRLN